MHWLKKTRWSICLLSATAAVGLSTPLDTWAQIKPGNNFGVRRPTTNSTQKTTTGGAAPAAPAIEETVAVAPQTQIRQTAAQPTAGGESAVQQELRKLYEESGREMPEVAAPYRTNFQQGSENAPKVINPAALPQQNQAAPPAPSRPAPSSGNPVTRFFKRLMPGGNSKPAESVAAPSPQPTRPAVPVTAQPPKPGQPPQRPSYAPYAGQQPRRLPNQEVVQTPQPPAAGQPLPNLPLPPSPAELPQSTPVASVVPKVVKQPQQPLPVLPEVATKTTEDFRPFEADETSKVMARSTSQPEAEPEFAPPILVEAAPMESPYRAIPLDEPAFDFPAPQQEQTVAGPAMPAAPAEIPLDEEIVAPVVTADVADASFPDPFPEMSEEEADDELDLEEVEMPYAGLKLDDDSAEEAADPFADPAMEAPEPALAAAPEKIDDAAPTLGEPLPLESVAKSDGSSSNTAPQPLEELVETQASAPSPFVQELATNDQAKPIPQQTTEAEALPDLSLPELPNLDAPQSLAESNPEKMSEPIAEPANTKPVSHQPASEYDVKMALIRERGGMKGLKGFCPVTLRDERELKDAQTEFASSYRGQKFHFCSSEAKAKFDLDPVRYVPAAYGADVVVLIRDKDVAEGSLDYAAWYKGKLYLFASEEAHNTFVGEPSKYASPPGLE